MRVLQFRHRRDLRRKKNKIKGPFHTLSDRVSILVLLIIIANKTNFLWEVHYRHHFSVSQKRMDFGTEGDFLFLGWTAQSSTGSCCLPPTCQAGKLLADNAGEPLGQGWKTKVRPISKSSLRFTAIEESSAQIPLLTVLAFTSGKRKTTRPLNISCRGTEELSLA